MEFEQVVRARKSVRKFKGKAVDFRDLMDAVDIANQGPFPQNHNHLKYLIIEDKKTIGKISESCEQVWIANAPALIVVCSDDSSIENVYGERGRIYSRQSAGAAVYSILLKLTEVGIGNCWIGSYSDKDVRKALDVPENVQIEAIIAAGFSEDSSKKSPKKELEASVFWEKWGMARRPTAFEEELRDYLPNS